MPIQQLSPIVIEAQCPHFKGPTTQVFLPTLIHANLKMKRLADQNLVYLAKNKLNTFKKKYLLSLKNRGKRTILFSIFVNQIGNTMLQTIISLYITHQLWLKFIFIHRIDYSLAYLIYIIRINNKCL